MNKHIKDYIFNAFYEVSPMAHFTFVTVVLLAASNYIAPEWKIMNVLCSILVGLMIFCEKTNKFERVKKK